MNELLLVNSDWTGGDLGYNFQRNICPKAARAFDELLQCLPFHKLHRVEVTAPGFPKVKYRSNVWMTNTGRRAGFAQKTKLRRRVTEIFIADDFQSHRAAQIDVERLVSNAHRTATRGLKSVHAACQRTLVILHECTPRLFQLIGQPRRLKRENQPLKTGTQGLQLLLSLQSAATLSSCQTSCIDGEFKEYSTRGGLENSNENQSMSDDCCGFASDGCIDGKLRTRSLRPKIGYGHRNSTCR